MPVMKKRIAPWQAAVAAFYLVLMAAVLATVPSIALADKNGFKLDNLAVPAEQVVSGGVIRDAIPALLEPKFQPASEANVHPRSRVLGLEINGVARAYPVAILNWHEIVNDEIDGHRVVVSFCPLCGTGMAFKPQAAGVALTFGVSGLLYNSDLLLYDHQSESLWSQILGKAISGDMRAQTLQQLPLIHTTWGDWVKRYPHSQLLTTETGHDRDYEANHYAEYAKDDQLYFRVENELPEEIHPKELSLGVTVNGVSRVYLFSELWDYKQPQFVDYLGGEKITVHWDMKNISVSVTDAQGRLIPTVTGYVFAWYAFYPDTEIFSAEAGPRTAPDARAL